MKIVDIAEFYSESGGGVRTYVGQKLEASAAMGCATTIVAPGAEDRVEPRRGGKVVWVKSPIHPGDHRYHWFRLINGAPAVHAVIDAERPDVVEASSTWQGGWIGAKWRGDAAKALVLHQDPVAVYPQTLFGGVLGQERVDRLFSWFWRYVARLSRDFDATVVSGAWFAEKLQRYGVKRPLACAFGIDAQTFSADLADPGVRADMLAACGFEGEAARAATLAVAVSRHHPEKRIGTLLRAVEAVGAERPLALYLIGDGPAWRTVAKQAAGVKGVHIAGPIKDRARLARSLASADFMFHGGAAETFGLVIAEALKSGLPIVVPNRGGAADLADPEYAETYDGGDWRGCADAIRRILARDLDALRAAVASHAIPRIRTPNEHFRDLFEHYAALVAEKRAPRSFPAIGVGAPAALTPAAQSAGAE